MVTDVAVSNDAVTIAFITPAVVKSKIHYPGVYSLFLTSHCDLHWSNCLARKVLGKTHHTNTIHTRLWNCYGVWR